MTPGEENGIITLAGRLSVDETVTMLESALRERGIKLFALVDHSGEAERIGLSMPPTKLLIFGNAKAGTPLMVASPLTALDLPLKILVWEDEEHSCWISYNSPSYLRERHGFPELLVQNLSAVGALASMASGS